MEGRNRKRDVMDWMIIFPPNSYVETLTPNVMVLGGGSLGGN